MKTRTKKIIISVIGTVGLLFAVICAFTYYAFSQYMIAENFCNDFLVSSWTEKIEYDMLSDELKEMLPRDEFELAKSGDAASKHSMFKRIEGFKSKSAVKIDYSTSWIKFPLEDQYEYNGENYCWDYYIDVVCFFDKINVVNFGCVRFYGYSSKKYDNNNNV